MTMIDATTDNAPRHAGGAASLEPLLVGRRDAARLVGVGQRTFDRWSSAGLIGPRPLRIGGKVMFRVDELRRWVSSASGGELPDRVAWQRGERERHET